MRKLQQSYILDLLLETIPELNSIVEKQSKDYVDTVMAESLYSIWKNQNNKVSTMVYKKPFSLSKCDMDNMQKEGLIRYSGDKIKFTSKGNDIIKIMILGNDKSSFDNEYEDIKYHIALGNVKNVKRSSKQNKKYEAHWWERFKQ